MATKKKAAKKAVKKAAKKPAAKKAAKKVVKKAAKKVAKKKSARKPNAAFMKPLTPSAELGAVVGNKPMPRTDVVKKIWVYIKANKLQDAKNRRMINADAKLKAVFAGKAQVSMFDMAKHLAKHLK
ncbi:MAG: SWIB/MDM2 domain-containing protein [Chitinophagaceae bacterium]